MSKLFGTILFYHHEQKRLAITAIEELSYGATGWKFPSRPEFAGVPGPGWFTYDTSGDMTVVKGPYINGPHVFMSVVKESIDLCTMFQFGVMAGVASHMWVVEARLRGELDVGADGGELDRCERVEPGE